jgi:phenylalanyl-tRNA synthetase beta chain
MRVPLSWLQEFVDLTDLSAEVLAEGLTCAGLEVEDIETIGPRFTHVYVARVDAIAAHPQADKLRLVTVTDTETRTLVCGAPNVRLGQLVALAKEGASVYSPKQQAWFTLGQAVIRGVPSSGMICSLDELDLLGLFDKPEDGIWPLNNLLDDAAVGQPLIKALGLTTETVFNIMPTANRGDAMSVHGIARELAAIFERPLTLPPLPAYNVSSVADWQVKLTQPDVCTAYLAVGLDNVTVGPSPAWVSHRLAGCGVRSINNVVDVTNLVMLELGQPLHAFDRDCLTGHTLNVQTGLSGAYTTLDGLPRSLSDGVPVVTLDDQPIALAGIMGGADTAVTDTTTRLLLEAAHFSITSTRKGSQALGLRTEASARFERGVDPTLYARAASRAVALLQQLAQATPVFCVSDSGQTLPEPHVDLRVWRLADLYGITLDDSRVRQILEALGFSVVSEAKGCLTVAIPAHRQQDVTREIDLIEEVVRIAGLADVPARLPVGSPHLMVKPDAVSQTLLKLREQWIAAGFQEVMTPSLVPDEVDTIGVLNSHSPEHTRLRQALLPSVLSVAQANLNKGQNSLKLFELGRVYQKQKAKPNDRFTAVHESWQCVALLTGQTVDWSEPKARNDADGFYQLKGLLQRVFMALGLEASFSLTDEALPWHPGRVAQVMVAGKAAGVLGELHPQVVLAEKLGQRVWMLNLEVSVLAKSLKPTTLPQISQYPAVHRDVAFKVPAGVTHGQLIAAMRGSSAPDDDVLTDITLFDVYRAERFAPGERSMAYRLTLQSGDKTLTEDMVKQRLAQVSQQLQQSLGIDCPIG